jgi:hydrogenase maturation protease
MILVIGYGNELRRDDAAGPMAAREIASWGLPDVEVIASHGLLPEMAEPLSRAELAVFIDARTGGHVEVTPISPEAVPTLGHTAGPGWLLSLSRAAFGRCPEAFLVTVPAADLGHGEGLSESTTAGLTDALAQVRRILARRRSAGDGLKLPVADHGLELASRQQLLAVDADGRRGVDADADAIADDSQHDDADAAVDHDLLIGAASEDQHVVASVAIDWGCGAGDQTRRSPLPPVRHRGEEALMADQPAHHEHLTGETLPRRDFPCQYDFPTLPGGRRHEPR